MTKLLLTVLFLSICLTQAAPRKIACVGNSITELSTYPVTLANLMGPGYDVRNFGVSGRILLSNGDFPYIKEQKFRDALAFTPDIVIIELGTNDSKPQNWKHKASFKSNYAALIDSFASLPSHPRILLCLPPPAWKNIYDIVPDTVLKAIAPLITKVAKSSQCEVVDLYTFLKNHREYFLDGVHPNSQGGDSLARNVYRALLKKEKSVLWDTTGLTLDPAQKLSEYSPVNDMLLLSTPDSTGMIAMPAKSDSSFFAAESLFIKPRAGDTVVYHGIQCIWKRATGINGTFGMIPFERERFVLYTALYLYTAAPRKVWLRFTHDDLLTLKLNGKIVLSTPSWGEGKEHVAGPFTLAAGVNTAVFRLVEGTGGNGFSVRFMNEFLENCPDLHYGFLPAVK